MEENCRGSLPGESNEKELFPDWYTGTVVCITGTDIYDGTYWLSNGTESHFEFKKC